MRQAGQRGRRPVAGILCRLGILPPGISIYVWVPLAPHFARNISLYFLFHRPSLPISHRPHSQLYSMAAVVHSFELLRRTLPLAAPPAPANRARRSQALSPGARRNYQGSSCNDVISISLTMAAMTSLKILNLIKAFRH